VPQENSFKFSPPTAGMKKKIFAGVDGCRAGWFAVFLAEKNEKNCEWKIGIFPKFSFLIDFLKKEYEQAEPLILIDIPIGLRPGGRGERLSDRGARSVLKIRKSSIFPVPCREAIYSESYEKACKVNEKLNGKRISKQAWNIVPKIRDVDSFLIQNEIYREKVKEVGPEICFQSFTDFPMKYSKKSPEGFLERKEVLKSVCMFTDEIIEAALSKYRRKEVAKDEILDALAAAITAQMGHRYGFEYIPCEPEIDSEGLKIQMVYSIPESNFRAKPKKE
jgi:predicted RNase H-like nuclease